MYIDVKEASESLTFEVGKQNVNIFSLVVKTLFLAFALAWVDWMNQLFAPHIKGNP